MPRRAQQDHRYQGLHDRNPVGEYCCMHILWRQFASVPQEEINVLQSGSAVVI